MSSNNKILYFVSCHQLEKWLEQNWLWFFAQFWALTAHNSFYIQGRVCAISDIVLFYLLYQDSIKRVCFSLWDFISDTSCEIKQQSGEGDADALLTAAQAGSIVPCYTAQHWLRFLYFGEHARARRTTAPAIAKTARGGALCHWSSSSN